MTIFETILFLTIPTALILIIIPIKNRWIALFFAAVSAIIIPINIIIDGFRWQMVLIYVVTVGILIAIIVRLKKDEGKKYVIRQRFIRRSLTILTIVIFLFSAIFPILLPTIDLPMPSGEYFVGTASMRLEDVDRKELFTKDTEDYRNILITIWYPADAIGEDKANSYWDKQGIIGKEYSINAGMGTFWYTHLSVISTNSYENIPISLKEEKYPVIIYSPSFYGLNRENTMLFEELASRGYIIFSINHSFETIVSVYPNGEAVLGNLDYVYDSYESNGKLEEKFYNEFYTIKDQNKRKEILKDILKVDKSSEFLIRERTMDVVYLLDEIERLNIEDSMYSSKIDLDKIGAMGWSFGGATAMEASIADARINSVINIDGWPYGEFFNSSQAFNKPFMALRSESDDEMEDMISELINDKAIGDSYMFEIKGAQHTNFWDFPLFFDVYKYLDYWGPIKALRLREIESRYIVGFFDKYLKGEAINIEELADAFPEVSIVFYDIN